MKFGVGKSGNIAKHCCDLLKCINYSCFYLNILNLTHGDVGVIKNNDIVLCFSNSGNTEEIINILPLIKNIGSTIIGICCNEKSKFKDLCDKTIITPLKSEISGDINKIPTNSVMSHLLFSNILVSLLKKNITLEKYITNHLSGNIGKQLLKVKDVLITEYPTIIINTDVKYINIIDMLMVMTNYKLGCCFFLDLTNKLIGILTDGDIRRYLLEYKLKSEIPIKYINSNYYYETDLEQYLTKINKIGTAIIPIISLNRIMKGYVDLL